MLSFSLEALTQPLTSQAGLEQAVGCSLLTKKYSQGTDYGFWGDPSLGCSDHELVRHKLVPSTLREVKHRSHQALKWLVDQNHVHDIDIHVRSKGTRIMRDIQLILNDHSRLAITM